ncbi:esterase/lipase [Frankia torreyi]|uniref:Esterase/lipase n=1 Tax=Frankia torreyi TaxID=1856 RepID=A0A0D8BC90_9ACTN|nr:MULTISPECIES: alpha/beta hydrolase [Frankia]KJE21007.1 esterase/lipase [Frankia torreyi]KQC35916.1 esterase [Frankia sp. ACN1ag]KQM03878.1 esterase/lipase [Frankia sp. CpI1-P]
MRYAIDPEIAPWIALLVDVPIADVAQARALIRELTAAAPQPDSGGMVSISERTIPGPAGAPDVRVRIYRPVAAPADCPAVLFLHGGGFILGDLDMAHSEALRFAELGCVVVSVDYRLAPEHPYPAAVDDCYAALTWLAREARPSLGVDPARIAVAGGSAGACLAAALTLLSRDRGGPALCFQFLTAPKLDDRLDTVSMRTLTDTPMWDSGKVALTWRYYLADRAGAPDAVVPPYAAPARAADLSGLPPAFVSVCEFDPLRDEGLAYAQRLVQAGVPTELHLYPGTFHGSRLIHNAKITRQMIADEDRAIVHRLGLEPRLLPSRES